ncbi:MAG: ferredoxin [Chitinivibrionales bacterium]|nr:ferredoxin [Chitinivibrionales bacterium]
MKARVNAETCVGCRLCADTCPAVFRMNDDGIAEVKADTVPADGEKCARSAAADCPSEAISIEG